MAAETIYTSLRENLDCGHQAVEFSGFHASKQEFDKQETKHKHGREQERQEKKRTPEAQRKSGIALTVCGVVVIALFGVPAARKAPNTMVEMSGIQSLK